MIKCFQLSNGHDIICDAEEDQHGINIKDPAAIHVIPQGQSNSFGVGLIPFLPFADGTIKLSKDKVVLEYEPSVEMRNNYSKLFGAGIQIANVMPR